MSLQNWEYRVTPLTVAFVNHIVGHQIDSANAWIWEKVPEGIGSDR
ncbi:MAG: hypothetical protein QF609_01855 [Gammaproteobacteria bacterium]|jgi:hypothetical protein|nr:hypothetical protein [Gammaproteobacteria bacterium]|tara:strand:- start:327 stop:464 length:138 start_codon:yes stop_codon:yes gene_type:complete